MAAAQLAPFTTVQNGDADPSPWRGGETYQLLLKAQGTTPGESWKHEAAATLTVRKVARGFRLTVRGSKWWSGSGRANCTLPGLVHAQDQDVDTDQQGYVSKLTLHPPPRAAPDLTGCGDRQKRESAAFNLWKKLAKLSGAAKQGVTSMNRAPMPDMGGDVATEVTLAHDRVPCATPEGTCRQGTVEARFRERRRWLGLIIRERLTIDADGRPHSFRSRHADPEEGIDSEVSILFRLASNGPPPASRPTEAMPAPRSPGSPPGPAQPAPTKTVGHPEANPSPWRGTETFDLVLKVQATAGPNARLLWKHQAGAGLIVQKIAGGFTLSVRGAKWWSGSGRADCLVETLLHAQEQDVTTNDRGAVTKMTLHPPPTMAPDLSGCGDHAKRQERAAAIWRSIAMLSATAKQEISSRRRMPMPQLGPDAFVDLTSSHEQVPCAGRDVPCRLATMEGQYQRTERDHTTTDRLIIDPEGRPHSFHRRQVEPAKGFTDELWIQFRPAEPGATPTGR